jgi:hypothetical protein
VGQHSIASQEIVARPSGWRRAMPSWPLIAAIAAVLMVAYRGKQLLGDPDTYLHIAAGNWMMAHRALPSADPFSWSMAGGHWVVHEWLAELALAAIQDTLGWVGLAYATALCFALSIALITRAVLRQLEPLVGMLVVLLILLLLEPHLLARAHVLALPALVAWCAALFAARDAKRGPPWAVLPVMVLWANLHGGYMFGIALAGYLGAEAVLTPGTGSRRMAEARRWGGFVLASFGCALLNANGLDGVLEPFRIISMPTLQSTFVEWQSHQFHGLDAVELWLLGTILLGFTTGVRLPPTRLILLLGLFHMALQHLRHEDLLAVVAPLALIAPLAPRLNAITRPAGGSSISRMFDVPPARAAWPAVALTLGFLALYGWSVVRQPIERENGIVTPSAALDAVRQAGITGRVFNSEHFGGYLIFKGVPVYIDGRMELYGDDFLKHYLPLATGEDPKTLTGLLDRDHVTWTILAPEERAVQVMDAQPGWRRIYADAFAVAHARTGSAP